MVIDDLKTHIIASGLLDNHKFILYRWYDDDLNGSEDLAVLRSEGGANVNSDFGEVDYRLDLVGSANDPKPSHQLALNIQSYLLSNHCYQSIADIQFLSDIIGPVYLENNRPVFQLNLRILESRSD